MKNPKLDDIAREVCVKENLDYISYAGEGAFKETYKASNSNRTLFAIKSLFSE